MHDPPVGLILGEKLLVMLGIRTLIIFAPGIYIQIGGRGGKVSTWLAS